MKNIFPPVELIARLTSPPWEIQAWDTARSWAYFTEYYLALPKERRGLLEAYRAYRAKTSPKQAQKITSASGGWKYFHDGLDHRGQRPLGSVFEFSLTWPQRALLRDIDLEKKTQLVLEQEIIEFRRKEIEIGLKLLDRAEAMLVAPLYVQEVADGDKTVIIKPADWAEGDIARTAAAGSKLARLGYELETDKVNVTDWRQRLVGAGVDPEQFIKIVARALATGSTQI